MESEITRSLLRVIHQAIKHCETKRLADYKEILLSPEFVNEVGGEMVDLFEQRLAKWKDRTPPAGAGASSGFHGGRSARQRGRG
jgi:hypothetical protein